MNANHLAQLATRLLSGELSLEQFLHQAIGIAPLGDSQIDLDRTRRCGFPEVVFAEGKTIAPWRKSSVRFWITAPMCLPRGCRPIKPRNCRKISRGLLQLHRPDLSHPPAKNAGLAETAAGRVTIVTAGTSDLPVAEEARETALWTGAAVRLISDVGVAGPHRLTANLPLLQDADAVVVVAGMEGALPSVVGGYVACPVIAVPTSVGYGASFGGIAALLGMLNSCAANVTVVNIDAGFKAGYVAGLIAKNAAKARTSSSARTSS